MKTAIAPIILVCFLVGAAVGGWYMNRKADEKYAYHKAVQLYKKSAIEMMTYSKLLRLTRNEEKESVIRYLEALLDGASITMDAIKNDVPEKLRLTVEATDYMTEYRKEHATEPGNAP